MPVNPANFNVGPQALRRYEQKRRWRQPYQFDQGSGQAVTYQTGLLVQLVRRPRSIGTKVSYNLRAPTLALGPSQPPVVTGPLGALVLQAPRRSVRSELRSPPFPNIVQSHYRFRNDDGTETTATWNAALDTTTTENIDSLFRLRISTTETMGGDYATTKAVAVEWRQNGGAWTAVGAENGGAVVQYADSPNVTNGTSTTQQITSGSFFSGAFVDASSSLFGPFHTLASSEFEYGLKIGHQGGASAGDTFEFRLTISGQPISATASPLLTAGQSAAPVVTKPRVSLAPQRRRARTVSTLGAPVVVSPAPPVVTKLRVTLAPSPRQGRWSGYGLAPPAIVDISPAPPLRVSLAQQKLNRRKTLSTLRPPTVVGAAAVPVAPFAPVRVTLAKWRRPRPTIHQLRIGLTATPTHDCRKPLLTETTQTDGTLTEASATRGSLSLASHSGGTLTDSGGTHGTLTESSSTKGNLTDNC